MENIICMCKASTRPLIKGREGGKSFRRKVPVEYQGSTNNSEQESDISRRCYKVHVLCMYTQSCTTERTLYLPDCLLFTMIIPATTMVTTQNSTSTQTTTTGTTHGCICGTAVEPIGRRKYRRSGNFRCKSIFGRQK